MPIYIVEMVGDVRELYQLEAETEEEAKDKWFEGDLIMSESSSMEFYSVKEEEE